MEVFIVVCLGGLYASLESRWACAPIYSVGLKADATKDGSQKHTG